MNEMELMLSIKEKKKCLEQILKKNKKILYVYEQSLIPDTGYDYKSYLKGLIRYVSSSNELFEGELINVLVNFYSIFQNDLEKEEIKRIVHENSNVLNFLLRKVGE